MSQPKCAECGKPQDPKFKPFCSKRCADFDLNRWFTGGYAIKAEEEDEPGEVEGSRRDED